MKLKSILVLIILSLACISCKNLNQTMFLDEVSSTPATEVPVQTVENKLTISVSMGFNNSRAAIPSALPANIVYFGSLYYVEGGTKKYLGQNVKNSGTSSNLNFVYDTPDFSGNKDCTLEVFAFAAGTTKFSTDYFASGSATKKLTTGQQVSKFDKINLVLNNSNKTLNGTVELKIKRPAGTELQIKSILKDNKKVTTSNYFKELSFSSDTASLTSVDVGIAPGIYTVEFAATKSGNPFELENPVQIINVVSGMETSKWDINGTLSDTLELEELVYTSIYVCGTDPGFYGSLGTSHLDKAGNDSNSGSLLSPFKTLTYALEKCTDNSTTYTIYVDGTFTIDSGITLNKNITIKGLSDKAILKRGTCNGTLLTINSGKTVVLDEITIDGNKKTVSNVPAGITNNGTLTLLKTTIKFCYTDDYGGAIWSVNPSKLYIYGSTITNNSAVKGGGAIYVGSEATGGDVEVVIDKGKNENPSKIQYNSSEKRGGAILAKGDARIIMNEGDISENSITSADGKGGALYLWGNSLVYSTFTMNGGSFYKNSAGANGCGGAVCIDDASGKTSSFTMNGGKIYGNNAEYGKAIWHSAVNGDNGQLNLSGYVLIKNDNDIYLGSSKFITITGNLTFPEETSAYVTLETPSIGSTVVKASTAKLIEDNISKIKINNDCWTLTQGTADDTAKKTGILKHEIYVAANGDNSNGNGSQEKPYATLYKAIDTAINGTIIYISGTINETQVVTIGKNVQIEKYGTSAVIKRGGIANTLSINSGSTVTMKDITIDGNGNNFEISTNGGGINNNGTLTLEGCTIQNCKTTKNGGGIYNSATLNLIDTVIKGCAVTGGSSKGNGIYNDGTLNIQGSTYLSENNDIYLTDSKVVTITGNLNPMDGNVVKTYTAYITTENTPTASGISVLTNNTYLANNYMKFASKNTNYCILSNGNLINGYLSNSNINDIDMSVYAGQNVKFILDSTVTISNLASLSSKIASSTAKVELDLSAMNVTSFQDNQIAYGNVTKLILPDSLSSLSTYSNFWMNKTPIIEEFMISNSNQYFSVEDGVLYNKDKTKIICYPYNKKGDNFILPNSVTTVGRQSFSKTEYLKTVDCSNVSEFETESFDYARSIETVILSNSVTSLPGSMFYEAKNIKNITIPESITSLNKTFYQSSNLETIKFLGTTPPELNQIEFDGCSKLTAIYVPSSAVSAYKSASSWTDSSKNAKASDLGTLIKGF